MGLNSKVRRSNKMKVVQFVTRNDEKCLKIGVLENDKIHCCDLRGKSFVEFLQKEIEPLEKLKQIKLCSNQYFHISDVKLQSPVTKPDKVLGLAMNFKSDCDKRQISYPKEPIIFNKFPSVITGPYDEIVKPTRSNEVDFEVELAVVIGKTARNVKAPNAFEYIFGYTASQDMTARDWVNKNGGQLIISKGFDGFCPLGPCLVTKDEISNPYDLTVKSWVNGDLKQNGKTDDMVHKIDYVIEYLTSLMTLLPGDVILTGTPPGYGSGEIPPKFLQRGDTLETEITNIGKMFNQIV